MDTIVSEEHAAFVIRMEVNEVMMMMMMIRISANTIPSDLLHSH
jgi:hypothetical protein